MWENYLTSLWRQYDVIKRSVFLRNFREIEQFKSYFYTMKERSEKKMETSIMKDNCLRIPNITRNL